MNSLRHQVLFVALLVVVAAVAVGCGGGASSSSGASASAGGSSATAELTAASSGSSSGSASAGSEGGAEAAKPAAAKGQVQAKDPVSEGSAAVSIEPRDTPLGVDNDEIQTTGAKPVEPCKLVTQRQAAGILGTGTTASERPQGPTCVYSNAGRTVTLVVEDNSVAQLRKGARKATKVQLGSRTGWCLKYQATSVVVGISGGRVLRADGACQAGVRFVTLALHRI
jgi:hypothetical protein